MSLDEGVRGVRLVKTGPSLSERVERKIAGIHHQCVVFQLCELREQIERDMAPESLGVLTVSAVVLLSDVCTALGLDASETTQVLGAVGAAALACETAAARGVINRRQVEALDVARKHGNVTWITGQERRQEKHSIYTAILRS